MKMVYQRKKGIVLLVGMITYKKIPNNENAIEIDGKIVLSFDTKYKEYLKWRDENPDLEQQLIDDLEQEIRNKELYNEGAPHTVEDGFLEWYNENGKLILESQVVGDKKNGEEISYYGSGQKKSETTYEDGKKIGEYTQWDEDGNKIIEGFI